MSELVAPWRSAPDGYYQDLTPHRTEGPLLPSPAAPSHPRTHSKDQNVRTPRRIQH